MKEKKNNSRKIGRIFRRTDPLRILVFVLFTLYASTLVYALFWAVAASLNEHVSLILNGLALPEKLHFENYIEAFRVLETSNASFFLMLWNSIWLTVANSIISLAAMVVTGYVLGKYSFAGKKCVSMVLLMACIIPVHGTGASTLRMYMRLGMYDSPLIVLKSASAVGMMTMVVKTFFQNIPMAYEESARIDGASRMRIFLQVHLPLVKSSLFAIFILQFIGGWNDYSLSIYYMPSYPTISSGLYIYEVLSKFAMNKPIFFAGVVLCAIPPMILYIIFNDKLLTNVSIGGIKG